MRTLKLSIVLFCLVVSSCKNDQRGLYSNLQGDWKCIDNNNSSGDSLFDPAVIEGYSFLHSGICHAKLGYFKQVTTKIQGLENAIGDRTEQTTTYFLGTDTKYKIEGDSLKIFNLTDSIWEGRKILRLSKDTLILQASKNAIVSFVKLKFKIDTAVLFDELIVSSSGCYGVCPVNTTIINQSGHAIYLGERYNNKNGLYTFVVTKDQYNQVVSNFKLARIDTLENNYAANWTDDEAITMTFLKEGKIIKKIRDYGKVGPAELYWAYMPVREMYQLKQLDTLKVVQSPIDQSIQIIFSFKLNFGLSNTEAFYLWNLLREAREINETFKIKYEIDFHGKGNIKKCETDGRYYKFETSDGNEKIFDIGFNFLDINEFSDKFKSNENFKVYK